MINSRKSGEDCKIADIKHLTDSTFILRFERKHLNFNPGCYITVGLTDDVLSREYSIYSGVDDDFIEVLVKEVINGEVSGKLKALKPGNFVKVDGPFGKFNLPEERNANSKFLFVATGTGISPFHSMIKSNKELKYKLLHGVRYANEAYEGTFYDDSKYTVCVSGEESNQFNGRVTKLLQDILIDRGTLCYLCGNGNMIYESYDILRRKGIPVSNIFTEVYF